MTAPAGPPFTGPAGRRTEALAGGLVLAASALVASVLVLRTGQLGWDEAVYATRARSLVTDAPAVSWAFYRPPGLPLVGTVAVLAGFGDVALRALTGLLGIATLGFVWLLGRQLWGAWSGVVALLAAAGAPVILRESRFFHNDIVSAGVLLLLMAVLWDQFERRSRPTPLLLAAAPIAAAAFYLRYGTAPAIAGIGLAAVLLWWPAVRRNGRVVGATVLVGGVLVAPHLVDAIATTGSPLGIVSGAVAQADTTTPIASIRQYLRWLPRDLAGPVTLGVIGAGAVHAALLLGWAIRRRRVPADLRRQAWLLGPAIAAALLVAVASHPERRYVVFPLLLGCVSGGGAIAAGLRSIAGAAEPGRRQPLRVLAALIAIVTLLGASAASGARSAVVAAGRGNPSDAAIRAGDAIATDSPGACRVVTTVAPILGWYSGCRATSFAKPPEELRADAGTDLTLYVAFTDVDDRRSSPRLLAPYRALVASGELVPLPGPPIDGAEVYRWDR